MKPKQQGVKEDGFATAEECLEAVKEQPDGIDKKILTKPYGLAVGLLVYSLSAIGIKVSSLILGGLAELLMKK
jgi:hypothetical protein